MDDWRFFEYHIDKFCRDIDPDVVANVVAGAMIIQADARHIPLADESVQTVVTSPPYWGLRDYGITPCVWGGDGHRYRVPCVDMEGNYYEYSDCEHEWSAEAIISMTPHHLDESITSIRGGGHKKATMEATQGSFCLNCNAWRGVLGLEPTPELYVQHMVEVFREVRRVLRKDGTVWLNLGDSYCANRGNTTEKPGYDNKAAAGHGSLAIRNHKIGGNGLKEKDLVGIPWRVAFALQADGWYLRRDIIWHKPNPMPESVTDRPTTAHEYIFLLTKAERYFYDGDAIREPALRADTWPQSNGRLNGGGITYKLPGRIREDFDGNRNKRSVWTVATQPFSEAHFATFPEDLIKPCILAGAPAGGIVLDPFSGSGTTVKVAQDLGRVGIGLELKADYIGMARHRSAQQGLIF